MDPVPDFDHFEGRPRLPPHPFFTAWSQANLPAPKFGARASPARDLEGRGVLPLPGSRVRIEARWAPASGPEARAGSESKPPNCRALVAFPFLGIGTSVFERRPTPATHGRLRGYPDLTRPTDVMARDTLLDVEPTFGKVDRSLLAKFVQRSPKAGSSRARTSRDSLEAWWSFLDSFGVPP